MMFKRKKREGGFSLIEVILTIMIITVALTALLSIFIYGFRILTKMKQVALATQCIQEEIELIRAMSYDDILNLGTTFTHDNLLLLDNGSGLLALEDSEGSDIKKLTVSVTWNWGEMEMQKDIVTYITREGINKK